MGLLDDAIREHLELKRRRGADAGEVAREQREILESDAASEADRLPQDDQALSLTGSQLDVGVQPAGVVAESHGGQPLEGDPGETAELEMESVLDSDGGAEGHVPQREIPSSAAAGTGEEESLEWEMPGHHAGRPPRSAPRDAPAVEDARLDSMTARTGDHGSEDVLEETPDFLRDTPEQERLWFEQRPPRDFEFDE